MSLKTIALFGTLGVLALGNVAQAQNISQTQISQCRAAITADYPEALNGYRLRFKSVKGNKTRVVTLTAIPNAKSTGDRFNVTCRISSQDGVLLTRLKKPTKIATR